MLDDDGSAWANVDLVMFCVLGLVVAYIAQARFRGRSEYDTHLQALVVDGWYFLIYNRRSSSTQAHIPPEQPQPDVPPAATALLGQPVVLASPTRESAGAAGGRQKLRKKRAASSSAASLLPRHASTTPRSGITANGAIGQE